METVAAVLLQLNPSLSSTELAPLFSTSPALVNALVLLAQSFNPSTSPTRQVLIAEQKVSSLRTSLAHLTTRLESLATRLSTSETHLAAVTRGRERELARERDERDGLRALCGVWESRWREERRLREDSEMDLKSAAGRGRGGKVLNGRNETTLVGPRDGWRPMVPSKSQHGHARRRSSSASSSSSTSSARTHLTTSQSFNTTPSNHTHEHQYATPTLPAPHSPPRLRTRQVVADLARELERVRREADRLLFERDEEITRLEDEQAQRRQELAGLYSSLDTLLALGGEASLKMAASVPLPATDDADLSADTETVTGLPSRRRPSSRAEPDGRRKKSSKAAKLEAEVRELEREIERMSRPTEGQDRGMAGAGSVAETSASTERRDPLQADKRHALAMTIEDLNAQVAHLRTSFGEMSHEREVLQRLYDRQVAGSAADKGKGKAPPLDSTQDLAASLSELQADRDRLAHLLHLASTENGDLSTQLSTTQSDIEQVSDRVLRKLVEQKGKLEDCHSEIRRLVAELEELERHLEQAERRAGEAEEGWERERRKCGILEKMVGEKVAGGREERKRERETDRSRSD